MKLLFPRRCSSSHHGLPLANANKPSSSLRFKLHRTSSCGSLRSSKTTYTLEDSSSSFGSDLTSSSSTRRLSLSSHGVIQQVVITPKRRVRFSLRHGVHDNPWVFVNEQNEESENSHPSTTKKKVAVAYGQVWYHQHEIKTFKTYVRIYAKLVAKRQHELQQKQAWDLDTRTTIPSWSTVLCLAYQGFHKTDAVDRLQDMNTLMATADVVTVDAFLVGLEKWALPGLNQARRQTRRALYNTIMRLQTTAAVVGASPDDTARNIRSASRDLTLPNRLLAIYVGRMLVQEDAKKETP